MSEPQPEQEAPESAPAEVSGAVPRRPHPTTLRIVQVATIIAVVAALIAAVYYREHLEDLQQYGYAAVFLIGLVSNATLILPVPGLAVSSVLGGVFNPWLVGIAGGIGQALGELTGYMAGYSGQTLFDKNPTYQRLLRWMQRYGMATVFVLGLVPNPVFDLGGLAAGALRLPVWKFLLSCAAGKIIKNIAFAFLGYYGITSLAELFDW